MDFLRSGVFLFLLISSRTTVTAETCGAPQTGVFLEDFHGGHSYLSYEIDQKNMKENSLDYQERFCTKNGSGIIAQLSSYDQQEDILIEVSDGYIIVHLMKGYLAEQECMFTLNKKVTDGASYLVEMEIRGKEFSVTLHRKYTKIYSLNVPDISACLEGNFSTFTFLEKGGHEIGTSLAEIKRAHLGPFYREKPHLYGDFDGCIGDSILNGIPVAKAGKEREKHDIYPNCSHNFGPDCTDICRTSYVVVENQNCGCPADSEIDGFGLCKRSCNCITCYNGGTCSVKRGSDAVCECSLGYEGRYCEQKVDPCKGIECLNGGSCAVGTSGPFCTCPPSFTGFRCEVKIVPEDPCEVVDCQNNATCEHNSTLEEKYFCSCLPGYYGKVCEYRRKDPCAENPCQNNATCDLIDMIEEKYVCSCLAGYYGQHCEHQEQYSPSWPEWKISVVAVVGLCFVVAVGVYITVRLRRRYNNNKNDDPRGDNKS